MSEQAPGFWQAAGVWARIGCMSFGGPAGQIALMHKVLVEEKAWIGERRFLHALNYCMLLPGPEAQQLATYMGWLMHRTAGGLMAGLLFILPGAIVMLALSIAYALFGATPAAAALFLGVKSAVLAIVLEALLRIGRRALKTRAALAIAAAAFLALYLLQIPFPVVIAVAGVIGGLAPHIMQPETVAEAQDDTPGLVDRLLAAGGTHLAPSPGRALRVLAIWLPAWLGPAGLLFAVLGGDAFWTKLAGFFSTMGVVTFGGAYAALAYVAQTVVESFGWLSAPEMADGLGLAETTPGPLVLVLQFVGFLAAYRNAGGLDPMLAGCLAAALTSWVVFAPSFLWIFLGAPYVERLRDNRLVAAALAAVTAAVVGVIANLAVWFGLHVLIPAGAPDWRAMVLTAIAMVLVFRLKVGAPLTLAVCAGGGLALAQV